jgi:hypothetical protein
MTRGCADVTVCAAASHDPYGANAAFLTHGLPDGDPLDAMRRFDAVYAQGYTYVVWRVGSYSHPRRAADDLGSMCSKMEVGAFMLALRAGSYLLCNGWDDDFARCESCLA